MRAGAPIVWLLAATLAAPASAQPPGLEWSSPCGERWAFVAGVVELGGSFEGFEVEVAVSATEAQAFRGRLGIARGGETLAARELEDSRCEDVIDALVIVAALALRTLPQPGSSETTRSASTEPQPGSSETTRSASTEHSALDTEPIELPIAETDRGAPPIPIEPAPEHNRARLAIGAALRFGIGPTPGPAIAPGLVLALELDRLLAALTLAFWPDSGASLPDGLRGVALWALGTTLEVGYRIGDEIALVPCAVIEPSAAFARGTGAGVERPREEATFVLDAGVAIWLALDLVDRVRLYARGDVLFGIVRPVYGVEAEVVFAGPAIRGSGGAGVLVLF